MNVLGTAKTPFFFLISFDQQSSIVVPIANLDENIAFKINDFRHEPSHTRKPEKLTHFKSYPMAIGQYNIAFDIVMDRIKYGDSYLVNLTIPTPIQCNLSMPDIYATAHAKYKLLLKDKLVVFSPECFIKIIDNNIYSFPMKGTIDAALQNAAEVLLNDEKELSEHYTIVDLIRNDLSMVSTDVTVTKFRFIDSIHTNEKELLQTSSEIRGHLSDDYHCRLGDIFHSLLPAGSISGAPKNATLDIIAQAEFDARGYYTGVFGIFDGNNLDSGVAIRYIESTNDQLIYRSGGGITAMSTVESEYTESINKVYVPIGRKHMD